MPDIVDWQQSPRRRRRMFFLVLAILAIVIFSSRTALSDYVDALGFGSLGYGDVFRKTLTLHWAVFAAFFAVLFFFRQDGSFHGGRLTKPICRKTTGSSSAASR